MRRVPATIWRVSAVAEGYFRLRIRYAKTGRLALLSHLELTRALERLVRRSGLPSVVTQGFSAHMRHAPGPALPVGTCGLAELFDVWLTEYVPAPVARIALQEVAPPGLEVRDVSYVDPKARGLAATHVVETYVLVVALSSELRETVRAGVARLLETGELSVKRKNKLKTYDLKTAIIQAPEFMPVPGEPGLYEVTMTLRSGEQGSIRPEVLLRAAAEGGEGGEGSELDLRSITRLTLSEDAS
ncbi:MAG: TIGR03936 family radical SAM-associated protein [Coriobacteriales bacterium]|jgi:radical SAM-linked protein|nr:TIGR03936 family radical SAM-associated protein [Coriobacteriales bacterium]